MKERLALMLNRINNVMVKPNSPARIDLSIPWPMGHCRMVGSRASMSFIKESWTKEKEKEKLREKKLRGEALRQARVRR
jgi:hypothetical protein